MKVSSDLDNWKKSYGTYYLRDLVMTPLGENSMDLTALSSEVSPALTNLLNQSYYQTYREHIQIQFEYIW